MAAPQPLVMHRTLLETPPQQQSLMDSRMSTTRPPQRPLITSSGACKVEKGEPLPLMDIHTAARHPQKQPLLNGPAPKGPTPLMNLQTGLSQRTPLMKAPPPLMNLQVDPAAQQSQFQPMMNEPPPLMNLQTRSHLWPLMDTMPPRPAPLLNTPPPKKPLMERPAPLLSTPSQQQLSERSMHQAPMLNQPSIMEKPTHRSSSLDVILTHQASFHDVPAHQSPWMNRLPKQQPVLDESLWQPPLLRTPPRSKLLLNEPPIVSPHQPPVVPLVKTLPEQQPLPNLHIENSRPFQEPLYINGPPPKRPLMETPRQKQPLAAGRTWRRRM